MARLTRRRQALHLQACELVTLDRDLNDEEKEFVLDHWQESSSLAHGLSGAFFTPLGLARDLALHVHGDRIVDLGAGIGHLAFACRRTWTRQWNNEPTRELVCVESNPDYVEVGRKILPEARWITADVFALPAMHLGSFDCAISNPPFGPVPRNGTGPRYRGPQTELHFIDLAADLAESGAFIVPQTSAPFRYSGSPQFIREPGMHYQRFQDETGIRLQPNVGIDTAYYDDEWHSPTPRSEVVIADFADGAQAG